MHRSNPSTDESRGSVLGDESGSAPLEFIVVGMLLLVPLVYLVVALGAIQAQALGAEAGARHVARTVATSPDPATAGARADRVVQTVAGEYGMDAVEVTLSCPSADACPEPGATLVVTLRTRVTLPLVPPVFGLDELASIPIEASALQKVSRFWGSE